MTTNFPGTSFRHAIWSSDHRPSPRGPGCGFFPRTNKSSPNSKCKTNPSSPDTPQNQAAPCKTAPITTRKGTMREIFKKDLARLGTSELAGARGVSPQSGRIIYADTFRSQIISLILPSTLLRVPCSLRCRSFFLFWFSDLEKRFFFWATDAVPTTCSCCH